MPDTPDDLDFAELPSFPPQALRDYAFVADGHRGALIGPRGDIAWMCVPHWDDDAVFSCLAGGAGVFAVTPRDMFVWGGSYEEGSLIWCSRWVCHGGSTECREALARPADPDRAVLLWQIVAPEVDTTLDVIFDARAGFGRDQLTDLHRDADGRWTGRTGHLNVRLTGLGDAEVGGDGILRLRLHVAKGQRHDIVCEIGTGDLGTPVDPARAWRATEDAWRADDADLSATAAPRDARQAFAVLNGLTAPGGGMVAAPTLGLPERAGAGRDYDYRYVWLRDQAYAGIAASVGDQAYPLMDDAVSFVTARILEHGPDVAPAYRADGRPLPAEHHLRLPGYPGGRAIDGNWVRGQFQLDTVGDVLTLYGSALRHDRLDDDARRALDLAVDVVEQRWREPDAGIWELTPQWWTESRLACVAGLRAVAPFLDQRAATRVDDLASTIHAETVRRCAREDGAWSRSPQHPGTDASLLLPPVRGALPADDTQVVATLRAVRSELVQDGYAYRFAPDDAALGETEGAFMLCGFAVAMAAWRQGDEVTAYRWFERNRAAAGSPGLLSEEFDVEQRQLRGNIPQGFVHAVLLEAATRLTLPPAG